MFTKLEAMAKQTAGLRDMSIIFFTDGQDTCSNMSQIVASIDKLKSILTKKEISSRFLTIGFTSGHDAPFLNRIAQAGSDLGNFFYVDTEQDDYPEQIKDALQSSLSMAQENDDGSLQVTVGSRIMEFKDKLKLTRTLADDDNEEDSMPAKEEVKTQQLAYDFTT